MNKFDAYFNLDHYEKQDLKFLMKCYKKFNGINKIKLNTLDKIIAKEHKYGYNRFSIIGIWICCGICFPFWILFGFIISKYINNVDTSYGIGFTICLIIGVFMEFLYHFSCDKIDYNTLLDRNSQISIFEYLENKIKI